MSEFFVLVAAILAFLCGSAIFFPNAFICVVMIIAVLFAFEGIYSRATDEKTKHKRDTLREEINDLFPLASDEQQKSIMDKVIKGADIKSFSFVGGVLWREFSGKKQYWRASGRWTDWPKITDPGNLYEDQRHEIEQNFPDSGLKPQDIHDLSIQLYFNWKIMAILRENKEVVVKLERRGEYRRLVFQR